MLFCFHNVYAVRTRPHSRRIGAAQEWRQRQREDEWWRDAVVVGEGERSRAHGRVAQGQWRQMIFITSFILALCMIIHLFIEKKPQQQQQQNNTSNHQITTTTKAQPDKNSNTTATATTSTTANTTATNSTNQTEQSMKSK